MMAAFTLPHAYCHHVQEKKLLRAINEFAFLSKAILFLVVRKSHLHKINYTPQKPLRPILYKARFCLPRREPVPCSPATLNHYRAGSIGINLFSPPKITKKALLALSHDNISSAFCLALFYCPALSYARKSFIKYQIGAKGGT